MKQRSKPAQRASRPSTPPARSTPREPAKDAQRIALLAAEAGLDKKASEVEIVDVTGKVDYADFLVMMNGHSDRHVAAIAEAVDELLSKRGFHSISSEGLPRGEWVLLDFVDVVVHVFQERTRGLYDLDGLWMDARRVQLPPSEGSSSTA
ncbi:MAG: ribosome silencing factor [Polyangiaceae bacterium]